MIDVSGQEVFGRYVIVQLDHDLNLEEVKAFGSYATVGNITKLYNVKFWPSDNRLGSHKKKLFSGSYILTMTFS